jgi:hypothetical protein
MTTIQHSRPRRTSHRATLRPAHRPSVELVTDGVIAAYVHDLSRAPRTAAPSGGLDRRQGATG